jgi:ATP-dependent DNA ligase
MILRGTFPSKTSPGKSYSTWVDVTTGESECKDNKGGLCPRWRNKLPNEPRGCTHTKDLLKEFNQPSPPGVVAAIMSKHDMAVPKPMLAVAMPDGKSIEDYCKPGWVLEEKFDGHRMTVRKRGDEVVAFSRPRADGRALEKAIPEAIRLALLHLPDCVPDGELMKPGGMSSDVTTLTTRDELVYVVFDLLELNGIDCTRQSDVDRRSLLETIFTQYVTPACAPFLKLALRQPVSRAAVQAIWDRKGEGAILKREKATYDPGRRSDDWVKVKKSEAHTVTIIGFKKGKLGPYATTLFRFDDGVESSCKTLDNETLREIAANPARFIGARLVISCESRLASGKPHHPMWDHIKEYAK